MDGKQRLQEQLKKQGNASLVVGTGDYRQVWQFSVEEREGALPAIQVEYHPDTWDAGQAIETATVSVDTRGDLTSDNRALIGAMPNEVDAIYSGFVVGAFDGAFETRGTAPQGQAGEWIATGNHLALSTEETSGWRLRSQRTQDVPPRFRCVVESPRGHVHSYTLTEQGLQVEGDRQKYPPATVHQAAEAMVVGQSYGAAAVRHGQAQAHFMDIRNIKSVLPQKRPHGLHTSAYRHFGYGPAYESRIELTANKGFAQSEASRRQTSSEGRGR